jgi:hypothetical protein
MNIKEDGKSQKADPRSADLGPVNLLPSAFCLLTYFLAARFSGQ